MIKLIRNWLQGHSNTGASGNESDRPGSRMGNFELIASGLPHIRCSCLGRHYVVGKSTLGFRCFGLGFRGLAGTDKLIMNY